MLCGVYSTAFNQRIEELKRMSSIDEHLLFHSDYNVNDKETLNFNQFKILKHCQSKFDCLLYEKLFIKNKKPLNVQSDSIKAKRLIGPLFDSYYCFGFRLFFFLLYSGLCTYIDYSSRLYSIMQFNLYLFVIMTTWCCWNVKF